MAFDPHYDRNNRVYVDFTNLNGDTRVVRYRVRGAPETANPASRRVLLKVHQPFDNHNGGQLQFGPDGLLYISLGDGGSGGRPQPQRPEQGPLCDHPAHDRECPPARRRCTPTASATRGGSRSTARPATCGSATSARTPGRRSTTSATAPPRGTNFGWSYYEGTHVFKNQPIDRTQLRFPVAVYRHVVAGAGNCSITGGYVYRGSAIPRLARLLPVRRLLLGPDLEEPRARRPPRCSRT